MLSSPNLKIVILFAGLLVFGVDRIEAVPVSTVASCIALDSFQAPDQHEVWSSGPCLLVENRMFNTPESLHETVPCHCPDSGVAVAFWGRLDNREDLAAALDLAANTRRNLTDPQLALAAWHRWGEALPEHLLGDFALAILDPTRRRVFLARDPLGVKPLYYQLNGNALSFATSIPAFDALPGLRLELDPDWIARYLVGMSMHHTATPYRHLLKLAPGHCMMVESPRATPRRYFTFRDDSPDASRRAEHWVEAYRALLEEAVRCRLRSAYPLGSETSGGLDSSTITGWIAKLLGQEAASDLHTFGYVNQEKESEYILETSIFWSLRHTHIMRLGFKGSTELEAVVERALRVLGHPDEHGNGVSHYPFYQECRLRGIRTLFSGFGGDEVVTHPGGRLWHELVRQRRYRVLWTELPGNPVTRARRLIGAVRTHRTLPGLNSSFAATCRERWTHQIVSDAAIERLNLAEQYVAQADYSRYPRINDHALARLGEPFVPTRLESCTLIAHSYGVEYRWPLLDVRLIQQYLSTPSIEKARWGMGRYLHRRAVEGVVPAKVQWMPGKNMGNWISKIRPFPEVIEAIRREEADLHPDLEPLVDRRRLRALIENTDKDPLAEDEAHQQLRSHLITLRWLNRWLHGRSSHIIA
ncbi:MAG: asparagine synthase-related protein [Candidatus Competibacter sp.]|nr:asparagine synthase-related protein [Candidatus Competibacter sp.]